MKTLKECVSKGNDKWEYVGEILEENGLACGIGEAKCGVRSYKGTFFNNQWHGVCRSKFQFISNFFDSE